MSLHRVLLGVITLFLAFSVTNGYLAGAPDSACKDLKPNHGSVPQTGTSPFSITFSPSSYTPDGSPINVTIESNEAGTTFKGFLLTARYAADCGDQDTLIGNFSQAANTNIICATQGITHTFAMNSGRESVTVQWIPPVRSVGSVIFRATVIKERITFWMNVESNSTLTDSTNQSFPCPTITTTTTTTTITTTVAAAATQTSTQHVCYSISAIYFIVKFIFFSAVI